MKTPVPLARFNEKSVQLVQSPTQPVSIGSAFYCDCKCLSSKALFICASTVYIVYASYVILDWTVELCICMIFVSAVKGDSRADVLYENSELANGLTSTLFAVLFEVYCSSVSESVLHCN